MNTTQYKFLLAFFFLIVTSATLALDCSECQSSQCCSGCTQSQNLWQPHSFTLSMSRELQLQQRAWYDNDHDNHLHGTFGVSLEYSHNWGEASSKNGNDSECDVVSCCKSLGSMPFWSSNQSNILTIGNNSNDKDLDGYQIGLGHLDNNNTGAIRLDPSVSQIAADLFLYVGAHKTSKGFWAKVHCPVGQLSIDPHLGEPNTVTVGTYPQGALSQNKVDTAVFANATHAFAAQTEQNKTSFYKKLSKGIINCKRSTSAQFGDLEIATGYNLCADETKHLGIALRICIPTALSATGEYVLEPIFGRNGHWGAGGELIGHWTLWEAETKDRGLILWFDGIVQHLFQSQHHRTFDLKANGKGSKYLLVAKYSGNPGGFQDEIQNAANITTLPVQSTFAIEGNFALMLNYHRNCWNFGIGYEGWGRSCEKLQIDCGRASTSLSNYAVLGRQTPFDSAGAIIDLAQPTAQINNSHNRKDSAGENPTLGILSARNVANRIPEDYHTALDVCGQQAHKAYTSKIFSQFTYNLNESRFYPYIGVTAGVEYVHTDNNAVQFWNVGAQGGFSF